MFCCLQKTKWGSGLKQLVSLLIVHVRSNNTRRLGGAYTDCSLLPLDYKNPFRRPNNSKCLGKLLIMRQIIIILYIYETEYTMRITKWIVASLFCQCLKKKYASPANSFHPSSIQSTRIQKWPRQYWPKLLLFPISPPALLLSLPLRLWKVADNFCPNCAAPR